MKFAYSEIETVFNLNNGHFNSLVIESQDVFVRLLSDIHGQIEGFEGESIISDCDVPLLFAKRAALLDAFVPFDLNRKALINKLIAALEKKAHEAEHFEDVSTVLAQLENLLDGLSLDVPCELIYANLTIGALIKAAGPELKADGATIAEKVLNYIELVTEYDCERLFFLVNIRSYIADDEMELFAQTIISHGYQVLDIESCNHTPLINELRVTIDADMCEIT